ncbi:MAG: lysophospholipid acyltransferase family protein [Wenzhouxiangella sp.]|jgi:KDO2-lipid IV(A) lauroyltransferase|nr:lysophospholipid acyltransferase family protein [Wenzhouxiangella sp.]
MKNGSLRISLLRLAARFLGRAPLSWLHAAAVPMAWLLGRVPWNKHGVIRRNLAACFPEQPAQGRNRLAQAHRVELLRLASELGALAQWPEDRLAQHLPTVEGWEHVLAAKAAGRGVLLVTGHLGNWEILNLELSRRIDMVTLYRAPDDPSLDRFISAARTRFGGRVVASGSAAMRRMLRQLRTGGAVGIAADIQPKRGDGVFVPFFDIPALTMTLVHRLALRTGCAVIFCHALRLPRGRGWSLHFQPAPPEILDPDPACALQTMNDWLSNSIRTEPAQYLWIYKRFSRRPSSSEPRFYPRT